MVSRSPEEGKRHLTFLEVNRQRQGKLWEKAWIPFETQFRESGDGEEGCHVVSGIEAWSPSAIRRRWVGWRAALGLSLGICGHVQMGCPDLTDGRWYGIPKRTWTGKAAFLRMVGPPFPTPRAQSNCSSVLLLYHCSFSCAKSLLSSGAYSFQLYHFLTLSVFGVHPSPGSSPTDIHVLGNLWAGCQSNPPL